MSLGNHTGFTPLEEVLNLTCSICKKGIRYKGSVCAQIGPGMVLMCGGYSVSLGGSLPPHYIVHASNGIAFSLTLKFTFFSLSAFLKYCLRSIIK